MKATTEKAFGANLQSVFSNPCEKWQTKKLGEIFSIERGGSPRPIERYLTDSQDGINWIKISDTRDITKYIYTTKEKIIPDGVKRSRMVYEGDFILSNSMSFGRPYIMKTQGCIHDGWLVLRNNQSLIDNDFLYYVLSSDFVYQQFNMLAYGSTVRNLNIGLVQKVKIPVPPLPEQHRIVSILDEAFTEIDKAKKNTEENIKKNKELFEAKLQYLFANTKSDWPTKKLGDICEMAPGGTPLKSIKEYWLDGKVSWYSSGELNELYTSAPRKCITHKGLDNSNTKLFPKGSLLIGIYDTAALKMSILDRQAAFNQAIVGIKPNSQIEVKFIFHIINAMKTEILNQRRGVRQKNLSFEKIKNIRLPLPPLPKQHDIITELDAISEETKKLEKLYRSKLTHLEELKKSILKQAFEGKL
jgi:type I restriction enzyme S subunit